MRRKDVGSILRPYQHQSNISLQSNIHWGPTLQNNNNPYPLITFFVFAYNQEAYIEEACKAALIQDYSPLEIIFSDDCSDDRTYNIMKTVSESYQGPHSIKLNRNPQNLGLINHVNIAFQISSGELIVAAAGDDVSLDHRVSRIAEAYLTSDRSALVVHSNARKIDKNGCDLGEWIPPIITQEMNLGDIAISLGLYIGATGAWSKKLFEDFGPLYYKNAYEDSTLGFRAALTDSLLHINKPLVNYRIGIGISCKKYSLEHFGILKKLINEYRTQKDVFLQRKMDLKCIKPELIVTKKIEYLFKNKGSLYWTRKFLRLIHVFLNKIKSKYF